MKKIGSIRYGYILLFCSGACFSLSAAANAVISSGTQNSSLLTKYCSQCHGVPNPDSHAASKWRSVIFRMQAHRQKRGFKLLSAKEIESLVRYLGERTTHKGNK